MAADPSPTARTTIVATGLMVLALAFVGFVVAGGAREPAAAVPRNEPIAGAVEAPVHVGGAGCSDAHSVVEAADPATPWCTAAHAAAAAPPGSTVLLAPGRHPRLELSGPPDAARSLEFRSSDPARPAELAGISLVRTRGVAFRDLRFVGSASVRQSQDVRLEGNEFDGQPIYVRQSQRVQVLRNRVEHLRGTDRGFLAQGFGRPGSATTEDLELRGNVFDDIDHDAIAVYNGYRNVLVADNVITRVHQPEDFAYHSDAMQFTGGDGMTVRGNIIADVSHGILFKDGEPSRRLRVQGNLVTNTPGAALQVFNAPAAVIARNTLWDVAYGLIVGNATTRASAARVTDNVLESFQLLDGVPPRAARNVFGGGPTVGRPAYRGAPRFLDARGGDFRIRRAEPGAGPRPPGAQLRLG